VSNETADDKSFHVLDAFLEDLHAGRRPDRVKFLAEHPELAGVLECLEELDELAPPRQDGPPPLGEGDRTLDERGAKEKPAPPAPRSQEALEVDFGKYEIIEEIGRGGMGVIYKARQKDLDRAVAIKMILSSHLASPLQVERFTAETRAMARLHHPNIVRIHDTGAVHGQHYFVMEYITGPSLAGELRKGKIGAERGARIVAQVARAVEHLHQEGIIHRDLKPSNILLDEKGQPYVTDFGLVKMLGSSSMTTTGAIVGTPAYMAPEQATGRPEQVGPLSDVYSLGTILYELLTGRPPFQEETALDTLVQVIESEPARPRLLNPALSRKLETICLKCLEKDPHERYPSAAALAEDLERFLGGDEVEARRTGPWQFLRRWARREPALVYRLVALLVLMVIVQLNYHLTHMVSREFHFEILALLLAWVLASVLCQQWLKKERRADLARLAWVGADAILLTSLLALAGSQTTALLVGYPFLIAASGLWFQVRMVWFTTVVCEITYGLLIFMTFVPDPREATEVLIRLAYFMPHYHVIFMVVLAVTGFVVAYQVQRILVLNRYYENRRLPA
jgi:serine/threonine-protein kinase